MPDFKQRLEAFRIHSRDVLWWAWKAWWGHPFRAIFPPVLIGGVLLAIGFAVHYQANNRFPSFQQIAGQPMSEGIIYILYSMIPAVIVGVVIFGILCIAAPSQIQLERKDRDDSESNRLLSELVTAKADFEIKDRRSQDALSNQEMKFKGIIGDLEQRIGQLQSENSALRDSRDYRKSLSVELKHETIQAGEVAQFRLAVTNLHDYRTIDDVRVRVLSLERMDKADTRDRMPLTKPLLAITNSGRMTSSPHKVACSIASQETVLFDFLMVRSDRRETHSLGFGDCVKGHPFLHNGNERWQLAYDNTTAPGMYRVSVEVVGRDVDSGRLNLVFWGDARGPRCVDANDPEVQSALPLSFRPSEIELLPANMLPHQLEALQIELRKPDYDGMAMIAAFWKINDDDGLCGLSRVRFVTTAMQKLDPLRPGRWEVVVSDEYMIKFPGGISGFPNAVRLADFAIAWKTVRDTE